MCGISGIYGLKSTDVAYRYVTAMNDAIAHRGPDDDGLFVEENIALGHRRLAILDLSPAGHQPMFDQYENLCIVFNFDSVLKLCYQKNFGSNFDSAWRIRTRLKSKELELSIYNFN